MGDLSTRQQRANHTQLRLELRFVFRAEANHQLLPVRQRLRPRGLSKHIMRIDAGDGNRIVQLGRGQHIVDGRQCTVVEITMRIAELTISLLE